MKQHRFVPIYAFLLAEGFLIFLLLYNVLGYGNRTILRGDLYVQYIDFIRMFLRTLKNGEDFWYSFSLYYGSGTILTYAYYAFSPFNLLYLIENISVPAMTIVIICLKIGFSASTFSYFVQKVLKCKPTIAVFFSICYAMNTFSIALHFNIIWLDAVYMLPLLITLLFRLIDQGQYLALVPAWFYLFLTNFYMGYVVGVFCTFVFIALLILRTQSFHRKNFLHSLNLFMRYIFSACLGAGCCSILLIPCAKYLISHMAADNYDFVPLPTTILEILNSLFVGTMTQIDNRTPFMYCGLPVLLLIPFYFICKEISLKERVLSGLILLIYIIAMLYLPLFIIFHAFDYPNYYFFRFSFCVSFLLCALVCRMLSVQTTPIRTRSFLLWLVFLITFYSFMIGFAPLNYHVGDINNDHTLFAINLFFMFVWFFLFLYYRKKTHMHLFLSRFIMMLSFIFLIAETSINGKICMNHSNVDPISEDEYNSWYNAENTVINSLPSVDNSLYRIAMYGDNNYNAPSFFGYAGFNTFSSSDDYRLRQALHNLGISATNRSITENGYTNLTRMLFATGYTASIKTTDTTKQTRECTISPFPYRLPIAYMVSDRIKEYIPESNPFENQEKLVECMTNKKWHFYKPLDVSDIDISSYNAGIQELDTSKIFYRKSSYIPTAGLYFSAKKIDNEPFYACFTQNTPYADASAPYLLGYQDNFSVSETIAYGCIYGGGNPNHAFSEDNETIAVFFSEDTLDEYPCNEMLFYRFVSDSLNPLFIDLNQYSFLSDSQTKTNLSGIVTATTERPILFTSIPWDEGWVAYVDHELTTCISTLDGAFLALDLTPGTHEIEFRYLAPGRFIGLSISIISLILFMILNFIKIKDSHQKNTHPKHSKNCT